MTIPDWAARAAAAHRAGRPLALLFDYDGTLAPLVPHPSLAAIPDATRAALAALADAPGVTLGFLSGRSLGDLRERVGLPGAWYAGSGGMHLDLDGDAALDPAVAAFDRIADALVTALSATLKWFPGTWAERKPGCLSLHFRALAAINAVDFVAEARQALAELDPDCPPLRVREVSRALEVALAGAWTKGDAAARMVRGLPANAFVAYAGDAPNDLEAFLAVQAAGGLTVGVGPDAPAAAVRLDGPARLADGLTRLAAAVGRPATVSTGVAEVGPVVHVQVVTL
jgi:trehalose-phosphatase